VGGGEGYMAALVRDLCQPATAHSTDLSIQACQRGGEIFGIQGIASDITNLPVADNSYDVVLCSEVIEHLSSPVLAIGELVRIARKYVVISTAEFCPLGEVERALRVHTLDASYPHAELNWFTARDFRVMLGCAVTMGSQFRSAGLSLDEQDLDRREVETLLASLTTSFAMDVDHVGVIALCPRQGADRAALWPRVATDRRQQILDRLLDPPAAGRAPRAADAELFDPGLLQRLRCVACRGAVEPAPDRSGLRCVACAQDYPVEAGVPAMFADSADESASVAAREECVARLAGGDPDREVSIRRLMERLHAGEARHHNAFTRWAASQLLRILWLSCRDEPFEAKKRRFLGRFGPKGPKNPASRRALAPAAVSSVMTRVQGRRPVGGM